MAATKKRKSKPSVAFIDITGCQGCLLSFLFNEDDLLHIAGYLDIKEFRFIKESKKEKKAPQVDVIFVEGLVACKEDLAVLKQARERAKILVALGACACTGCIPAYRNYMDLNKFSHLFYNKLKELSDVQPTPIDAHVEVDYHLPGCPPSKTEILRFIKELLLEKTYHPYDKPVCFECRLNENRCLLGEGKMCLGPITTGGCDAVCPNGGWECWGCRGPVKDANIDLMVKLLEEKGFKKEEIKQRIKTFVGMKIEEPPEQNMKEVMAKLKRAAKKEAEKERARKAKEKEKERKRKAKERERKAKEKARLAKAAKAKKAKAKKAKRKGRPKKMTKKKVKKKKKVVKKRPKKKAKKKRKTVKRKKAKKKKAVKKKKKTVKKKKAVKKKKPKKKSVKKSLRRKKSVKKKAKKKTVKKPVKHKKSVKKKTKTHIKKARPKPKPKAKPKLKSKTKSAPKKSKSFFSKFGLKKR